MSLRLFTISTLYRGNLDSFYLRFNNIENKDYGDHYDLLINDTTEFAGSYYRTFRKLGVDASTVVANDNVLQNKWRNENGFKSLDQRETLSEQVRNFEPDILWIDNLGVTDCEWLDDIRKSVRSIKLIVAYHCSPFGPGITERMKHVDFILTCTPGLKMSIDSKGCRSYLVYHGFDKDILDRIGDVSKILKDDFVFTGSLTTGPGYHAARIELIEKIIKENIGISLYVDLEKQYRIRSKQFLYLLDQTLQRVKMESLKNKFPVLHYGSVKVNNYSPELKRSRKQPVYGLDMYRLLMNSKVVLNYHIGISGDYAGNMRLFEATGTGSCLLTDNKSNISDLFYPGKEVVVYDNQDDCIEKARWLLDNEEERRNIALSGHMKTIRSHTVEQRCRQILDIFDNELKHKYT